MRVSILRKGVLLVRSRAGTLEALTLLGAALAGIVIGLGAFTMHYARGTSYLSSNPEACANCHIMWPQFDSWTASSHKAVARCVDCHLPHPPIAKWIAKAENGWHHSLAFTLQNFTEPIRIKPQNLDIVQRNCVACHTTMVHEMLPTHVSGEAVSCMHCHAAAGHAAR